MRRLKDWLKKLKWNKIDKLRKIAEYIKDYYLEKSRINNSTLAWDVTFKMAREEIFSIGITKIEVKFDVITITCQRPGILIGSRGANIHALQTYLQKMNKRFKINIKEELVLEYLIPYVDKQDYLDY